MQKKAVEGHLCCSRGSRTEWGRHVSEPPQKYEEGTSRGDFCLQIGGAREEKSAKTKGNVGTDFICQRKEDELKKGNDALSTKGNRLDAAATRRSTGGEGKIALSLVSDKGGDDPILVGRGRTRRKTGTVELQHRTTYFASDQRSRGLFRGEVVT